MVRRDLQTKLIQGLTALLCLVLLSSLQSVAISHKLPNETIEYNRYLKKCQDLTKKLALRLALNSKTTIDLSTYNSCMNTFVSLQNPALVSESRLDLANFVIAHSKGTRNKECGWGCSISNFAQNAYLSRIWNDESDYLAQINDHFNDEDRELLQRYYGGLDSLATKAFQKGDGKAGFESFNLVVIDLSTKLVESEMRNIGLEYSETDPTALVNSLSKKYNQALVTCLKSITNSTELSFCTDKLKVFAASQIGLVTLEFYLDQFFMAEVKDADKEIIRILKDKESVVRHETCHHRYPFCWQKTILLIRK